MALKRYGGWKNPPPVHEEFLTKIVEVGWSDPTGPTGPPFQFRFAAIAGLSWNGGYSKGGSGKFEVQVANGPLGWNTTSRIDVQFFADTGTQSGSFDPTNTPGPVSASIVADGANIIATITGDAGAMVFAVNLMAMPVRIIVFDPFRFVAGTIDTIEVVSTNFTNGDIGASCGVTFRLAGTYDPNGPPLPS